LLPVLLTGPKPVELYRLKTSFCQNAGLFEPFEDFAADLRADQHYRYADQDGRI